MSFLQASCVFTFFKYHPDWKVYLWKPTKSLQQKTWKVKINKGEYQGKNYSKTVEGLPNVSVKSVSMTEIGFQDNASSVHQSDYLRYWAIYTHGGYWADFDVLFLRPITSIVGEDVDCVLVHWTKHYPIGFFGGRQNSPVFRRILNGAKASYDPKDYFCLGKKLWTKMYPFSAQSENTYQALNYISKRFPNERILIFDHNSYLPVGTHQLYYFTDPAHMNKFPLQPYTIGVHWFNGNITMKNYQTRIGKEIQAPGWKPRSFLEKIIAPYRNQYII